MRHQKSIVTSNNGWKFYIYMYFKSFAGRSIICLLPDKNPVDSYAYEVGKSLRRTSKITSILQIIPILQIIIELEGTPSRRSSGEVGRQVFLHI